MKTIKARKAKNTNKQHKQKEEEYTAKVCKRDIKQNSIKSPFSMTSLLT